MTAVEILGAGGVIVANLLVWVFFWGGWRGKVNTRLNNIEKNADDPPILPQCYEIFTEIKEKLAGVFTKVELMYNWMNEDKKNSEKKHTSGK